MRDASVTVRLAGLLLGLTAVCARGAAPSSASAAGDARVQRAQQELATTEKVLANTTNDAERAEWQQRVELTRKSLENVERLAEIEQREREAGGAQASTPDALLRRALTALTLDAPTAQTALQGHNVALRQIKARRALYARERDALAPAATPAEVARAHGRVANADAELQARLLERDAAQLTLRLADDLQRIEALREEATRRPRPTVRQILLVRQSLGQAEQTRVEWRTLQEQYDAQVETVLLTQSLAEERLQNLDAEVKVLEERANLERKDNRRAEGGGVGGMLNRLFGGSEQQSAVKRELAAAREEQVLLKDRLGWLQQQGAAAEALATLTQQAGELIDAEVVFRRALAADMQRRYRGLVLVPLGAVLGLILLYGAISRWLMPLCCKAEGLFVARRLGGYALALAVVFLLVVFFLEDLKAIATVMGIVGAAVVIALQDLCSSFAGWFVIVASRKVRVGDRVEIGGRRGDVVDVQMLRTTLVELNNWLGIDEPTGRILVIPNSFIFKEPLLNYSHVHPYIWGKLDITVTYETPALEARAVLLRALTEETAALFAAAEQGHAQMERKYGAAWGMREPRLHTVIDVSGVTFSLFYVTHYRHNSSTRTRIMERILLEFAKDPRLQFAYPTERVIPTPEGKGLPVVVQGGKV